MQKMQFPREHVKYGEFVLHSGWRSNALYDGQALLKNTFYSAYIMDCIPYSRHYVGIETGGKEMAEGASKETPGSTWSYINKAGELVGDRPEREWILLDDVVTTGRSLKQARRVVGSEPRQIRVILDRRIGDRHPEVFSIFEPEPAWLLF